MRFETIPGWLSARTRRGRWLAALAVALLLVGFTWLSLARSGVSLNLPTIWAYRQRFFAGFAMTIVIALASMVVSLAIGMLTAAAQRSAVAFWRVLAKAYVQLIRGTPLLVQIYFFYYLIGTAWGVENRYVAGILILSLFEGAYIAEIIRGGWQSITAQTWEIAKALALTRRQTFRLVTLPLLLQRTVPALAGQFASVIKDSSLLSVIAVIELTQTTQEVSAENFQMFANYLLLGALYLALTLPVSVLSQALERKVAHAVATE